MTKACQKGVRKVNEMKIKANENKWGPLRVHRMKWKVQFRELTGWRPKNDEERRRTAWKSSRKSPWKRYGNVMEAPRLGFSSRNQFFSLISSHSRITRRAEQFSSSPLPLFIGKWGRCLPPSSPRRARLLPPEAIAFWRNFLEGPSGHGCYLHLIFTKYTTLLFFGDSFSVTLRNFTNFITMLVFFL